MLPARGIYRPPRTEQLGTGTLRARHPAAADRRMGGSGDGDGAGSIADHQPLVRPQSRTSRGGAVEDCCRPRRPRCLAAGRRARAMTQFDAADVRRYYDRHTRRFIRFGQGGGDGAIHRAVWGAGVETRGQAFHFVDDRIADLTRVLPAKPGPPHLVDLGCGVAGSLCYLARQLPMRGTGVTLSPVQVRIAAERIRNAGLADRVRCIEADFSRIPASVDPADLAYAIESFVHGPAAGV